MQQKRQEIRQANPEQAQVEVSEKTEFIPDRKSLKNYIRYSGKNKDVTLSFSAMALGGDVQFNQSNNSLMITNLPARLLKQLKQEADFDSGSQS